MGSNDSSQPASKSSCDSQDFGDISMVLKMAHFRTSTGPQWVETTNWQLLSKFHKYCCNTKYGDIITNLLRRNIWGIIPICLNITIRVYGAWIKKRQLVSTRKGNTVTPFHRSVIPVKTLTVICAVGVLCCSSYQICTYGCVFNLLRFSVNINGWNS